MRIEFDSEKDAKNIHKHGVPLGLARLFDEGHAVVMVDGRKDYGETRYVAIVPLPLRLHILVYTRIAGGISLRKANKREEKIYAQKTAH